MLYAVDSNQAFVTLQSQQEIIHSPVISDNHIDLCHITYILLRIYKLSKMLPKS